MGLPPRILGSRFRRSAVVVVVGLLLAACTGNGDSSPDGPESPQTSPPPITSAESYVFTDAAGIEARLTLEGQEAVLSVTNDTGDRLPEPGILVLDARDGGRTIWTVVDAAPLPSGESEWQVERTPVPEAKHIGLVVLLLGGEDYGAFVPPETGGLA